MPSRIMAWLNLGENRSENSENTEINFYPFLSLFVNIALIILKRKVELGFNHFLSLKRV